MNSQRVLLFFAGLAILAIILAADHFAFIALFHMAHITWYLGVGGEIAVVSSLTSLVWGDMDQHLGLISPHPFDYIGSHLQLLGLPIYALGTLMRKGDDNSPPRPFFDTILTALLMLALVVVTLVWLIIVVPPQYFLYLVCGAPARTLTRAQRQPIAKLDGARLEIGEVNEGEKIPEGWWSVSIAQKPLAVTNLFVALVFLLFRLATGAG